MATIIETERLTLRTWRKEDTDPYFQINQDPQVMEYFPGLQDLETTKNFITKVNNHFDKYGFYSAMVFKTRNSGSSYPFSTARNHVLET